MLFQNYEVFTNKGMFVDFLSLYLILISKGYIICLNILSFVSTRLNDKLICMYRVD